MTVHGIRHTCLTRLRRAAPLPLVQKFARHADPRITSKYVHPDEAWVREAANKLPRPGAKARRFRLRKLG